MPRAQTPARVPFTVNAGEPVTIDVTGANGKPYRIKVALAIFDVLDKGETNPASGMPLFDVRANVAVDVQEKK